jgi:hypothetical protein
MFTIRDDCYDGGRNTNAPCVPAVPLSKRSNSRQTMATATLLLASELL